MYTIIDHSQTSTERSYYTNLIDAVIWFRNTVYDLKHEHPKTNWYVKLFDSANNLLYFAIQDHGVVYSNADKY